MCYNVHTQNNLPQSYRSPVITCEICFHANTGSDRQKSSLNVYRGLRKIDETLERDSCTWMMKENSEFIHKTIGNELTQRLINLFNNAYEEGERCGGRKGTRKKNCTRYPWKNLHDEACIFSWCFFLLLSFLFLVPFFYPCTYIPRPLLLLPLLTALSLSFFRSLSLWRARSEPSHILTSSATSRFELLILHCFAMK